MSSSPPYTAAFSKRECSGIGVYKAGYLSFPRSALIVIHKSGRAVKYRHSGMDAGIQSQGCESLVWYRA